MSMYGIHQILCYTFQVHILRFCACRSYDAAQLKHTCVRNVASHCHTAINFGTCLEAIRICRAMRAPGAGGENKATMDPTVFLAGAPRRRVSFLPRCTCYTLTIYNVCHTMPPKIHAESGGYAHDHAECALKRFRIFFVFQDVHSGQTLPGSAFSLASASCSLNSVGIGLGGSGMIERTEIVSNRGRDFCTLDGISSGARELPETDMFMMQNSVLLPHHPAPQYGEGFLADVPSGSCLHRGA